MRVDHVQVVEREEDADRDDDQTEERLGVKRGRGRAACPSPGDQLLFGSRSGAAMSVPFLPAFAQSGKQLFQHDHQTTTDDHERP